MLNFNAFQGIPVDLYSTSSPILYFNQIRNQSDLFAPTHTQIFLEWALQPKILNSSLLVALKNKMSYKNIFEQLPMFVSFLGLAAMVTFQDSRGLKLLNAECSIIVHPKYDNGTESEWICSELQVYCLKHYIKKYGFFSVILQIYLCLHFLQKKERIDE